MTKNLRVVLRGDSYGHPTARLIETFVWLLRWV